GGQAVLQGDGWRYAVPSDRIGPNVADGPVKVMLRPEQMTRLAGADAAADRAFVRAVIRDAVYLGSGIRVFAVTRDGTEVQITHPADADARSLERGCEILLGWKSTVGTVLQG